jgi:hypothetical protein
VQEKQPCKVLIDSTRSAYDDRQEDDGLRPIHVYLTIILYLYTSCLIQSPVRLMRESIVFSGRQDNIILDLDVTPFIVSSRSYCMSFNSVTNRSVTSATTN